MWIQQSIFFSIAKFVRSFIPWLVGWLALPIRVFLFQRFGLLCIIVTRPRCLTSTLKQRLRSGLFYPENVDIQFNRIPLTLKTLCCFFTAFPLRILRLFAYLFLISELGFKIVLLFFWCTFRTQKKVRKNEKKRRKRLSKQTMMMATRTTTTTAHPID